MRRLSIGVRLAAVNGLVLLAAMAALGAIAFVGVDRALVRSAERALEDEVDEIADMVKGAPWTESSLARLLEAEASEDARVYQISFRFSRPDGTTIGKSGPVDWAAVPPPVTVGRDADNPAFRTAYVPRDEHRQRIAAARIDAPGVGPIVLEICLRLRAEDEVIEHLLRRVAVGGPIAVVVAFTAGVFLARRALGPIDQIDRAARTIGGSAPGTRLPQTGTGDELDRLAATLNEMLARLEAASARNLAFAGDVAHELRTPLATIRARVEHALSAAERGAAPPDPGLEAALRELGRLETLVKHLLLLARAEEGRASLPRAPADLAGIAREVVEFFAPVAESRGVRLAFEANGAAPLLGDPASLHRAVANLLENALRHTPSGGEVRVRAHGGPHAVVEVEDTGPGIEPSLRPQLFERFFQSAASRAANAEGYGLGLAIVRAIARGHGGDATFAARDGGGSVFRVEIPSA